MGLNGRYETVRVVMKGIRWTIGSATQGKAPTTADLLTKMLATCRSSLLAGFALRCGRAHENDTSITTE